MSPHRHPGIRGQALRCLLAAAVLLVSANTGWAAIGFRAASNSAQSGTSFVSYCTASNGTKGGLTLTLSTSCSVPSVGDVLIAQVVVRNTPTITTPSGWTLVSSTSTANIVQQVYWRVATSGALSSIWNFSSSQRAIGGIAAFRNVDSVSPINNVGGQATASSTTVTAPSQTQTAGNSMVVALFAAANGSANFSAATSMNEAYDVNSGTASTGTAIALDYQLNASSGSTGNKTSTTTSADNVGHLLVLTPSTPQLSVAVPTGTLPNDVMVATVAYRASSLTVTAPSGWTQVNTTTQSIGGTNGMKLTTWYRVAGAAEPASYTWTFPSGTFEYVAGGIASFSGVDALAPINAQAAQPAGNGSTYSFATPSIIPNVNGAMLVGSFAFMNGDTWTPPSTFTEVVDAKAPAAGNAVGISLEMAYNLQTTAATVSATATANNTYPATYGATQMFALRAAPPDHYELSLPGTSISCQPTTATVTACADISSPCTNASTSVNGQTATLTPSAGTLGSTTVVFSASGVATTTLSYPAAANGAAVSVTLSGETAAAANARKCCPNGTSCAVANSCSTTFSTAGFIVAAAANGAATTVPTQTAGTSSSTYYLRAVQTNTSTKACETALSGPTTVNWAYECNDPLTCSASNLMSLNGGTATTIQRNNSASVASYTSVPMTFDANGNAPFTFNFSDAGKVTLWATKIVNSATLSGSSNAFVTKPAAFVVTGIQRTANPQLANPAASTATGRTFVTAGEAFTVTVTATASTGTTTPNYGSEASPEGVLLTPNLVFPAGANTGTVSNATIAGGSFRNGVATVTDVAWSEVGIITLTPSVGDASYLGTGDVTGTTTGKVGRFYPDHFTMLAGASVTPYCGPTTAFTYMDQPALGLAFTIEARSVQNSLTTNYRDGGPTGYNVGTIIYVVVNANDGINLGGRLSGLPAATWSVGAYAVNAASVSFDRPTVAPIPDGPYDSLLFGVTVIDPDGATIASYDVNTTAAANRNVNGTTHMNQCRSGCRAKSISSTPTMLRFGRLRIGNRLGSPQLALPIPLAAEYWNGIGFVTHAQDSCTRLTNTDIAFSNAQGFGACATSGSPAGANAIVFSNGLAASFRLSPPLARGSVDLAVNLAAPGGASTCTGGAAAAATTRTATWLQGNWGANTYDRNPSARASFGLYSNTSDLIYRREQY